MKKNARHPHGTVATQVSKRFHVQTPGQCETVMIIVSDSPQ